MSNQEYLLKKYGVTIGSSKTSVATSGNGGGEAPKKKKKPKPVKEVGGLKIVDQDVDDWKAPKPEDDGANGTQR